MVTLCAALATMLFAVVLVTKALLLAEDGTARMALLTLLATAVLLGLGARAAWQRSP